MRSPLVKWCLLLALLTACGCAASAKHGGFGQNDARVTAAAPAEPPPPPMPHGADEEQVDFGSAADTMTGGMAPPPEPAREYAAQEMMVVSGSSGGETMRSTRREEAAGAASPPAPPPQQVSRPSPGKSGADRTKAEKKAEQGPGAEQGSEAAVVQQPMLIYTAGITMMVAEIKAALARVEGLTREIGGYLARRDDVSITIRVPVARFDEAVRRIEELGQVIHRNVSVEDVTEEFTDLEVRLRNLRAIRARLEGLLAKAKTVEESVLIERELGRVAGEIDRIEGRMKLLRDRAAFSTITVSLKERPRESIGQGTPRLPVSWLDQLGLGRLLSL